MLHFTLLFSYLPLVKLLAHVLCHRWTSKIDMYLVIRCLNLIAS